MSTRWNSKLPASTLPGEDFYNFTFVRVPHDTIQFLSIEIKQTFPLPRGDIGQSEKSKESSFKFDQTSECLTTTRSGNISFIFDNQLSLVWLQKAFKMKSWIYLGKVIFDFLPDNHNFFVSIVTVI